jgi:hypothetical protein
MSAMPPVSSSQLSIVSLAQSTRRPVCDVRVRTTPRVGRGQGFFFNKEIAPPVLGGAANGDSMEGRYTFD